MKSKRLQEAETEAALLRGEVARLRHDLSEREYQDARRQKLHRGEISGLLEDLKRIAKMDCRDCPMHECGRKCAIIRAIDILKEVSA